MELIERIVPEDICYDMGIFPSATCQGIMCSNFSVALVLYNMMGSEYLFLTFYFLFIYDTFPFSLKLKKH